MHYFSKHMMVNSECWLEKFYWIYMQVVIHDWQMLASISDNETIYALPLWMHSDKLRMVNEENNNIQLFAYPSHQVLVTQEWWPPIWMFCIENRYISPSDCMMMIILFILVNSSAHDPRLVTAYLDVPYKEQVHITFWLHDDGFGSTKQRNKGRLLIMYVTCSI